MNATKVATWTATIWCGLREGYDGSTWPISNAESICWKFCNEVSLCVSVTPTSFMYKGGWERGVAVGFMAYPRFPEETRQLREKALQLAERLMEELGQLRVSVVFPDETVMLSREENT